MLRRTGKPGAVITLATLVVLSTAGCSADSSMSTDMQMAGLPLSAVGQANNSQALSELRRITASYHNVDAALAANYSLLIATPLTAADGCISDMSAGGMGYHYSRFNNLGDNSIDLLDPEFLVYAPTAAPAPTAARRRPARRAAPSSSRGGASWDSAFSRSGTPRIRSRAAKPRASSSRASWHAG